MKNKNPLNADEKARQVAEPKRIEPQIESDDFSPEERKKIVRMVMDDAEIGKTAMANWVKNKEKDIQHLNGEKPSVIEGLTKEDWMSDRNLGICAATCDVYQSILLATCYNPDMIHYVDVSKNDIDNRDNLAKFTKWVLGPQEANFFPEVDDFIANKVGLGFSLFKIEWEVTYDWVDRRIPVPSKDNSKRIIGYKIEEENRRRERGVIRNIDHLDDILIPEYGKHVQDLPFLIEILHMTYDDLMDYEERDVVLEIGEDHKKKLQGIQADYNKLKAEDERALGTDSNVNGKPDAQKRSKGIDIYESYIKYKKNGKYEWYRFWVEPTTELFLSGMPLRKITRSGKLPYAGGPLRRRPGFLRGGSLPSLISNAINALNNIFNQTSDFQFFENCPFGYYDKNSVEGTGATINRISPGKLIGVDGDPNKLVMFPNLSRSLAWSYQMIQFLMQTIERLTGAASYFLASDSQDATATRDKIVEEKGQQKFGLWVMRTQAEIAEAINMLIQMYQDWAPSDLGKRVLGEKDGKEIIKNLSINSIRGNYGARILPDVTAGSKAHERAVALWSLEAMQNCIWLDPRVNPRGNWLMWKDAMKKQGIPDPEQILPPMPKAAADYSEEAQAHFDQIKQGESPEPPDEKSPEIVECFASFVRFKETKYHEIDKEYQPNFDAYFFKAMMNYTKFMRQVQMEQIAMKVAAQAAGNLQGLGMAPPAAPGASGAPMPKPNGNSAAVVGERAPVALMGAE